MIDAGIATSDTGHFFYQEPPYSETASFGSSPVLPGLGDLRKKVFVKFSGKKFTSQDTSVWNESYAPVLEDENNLEELFQKENLLGLIQQRISVLERLGEEDGVSPSEESKNFLKEFFSKRLITKKPFIFLLENGNFRAVWKDEEKQQIGLQFLPDGNIQFVIFAKRPQAPELAQSYGVDTPEGITRILEANRSQTLLYS